MTPAPDWKDLPIEHKLRLTNGCGGKGGWFRPPQYRFMASCDRHDYAYLIGHTEADRVRADYGFLQALLRDAELAPVWQRWWLKGAAWRYYWAVRIFGRRYFHYASGPRTAEDIQALLARRR